jgi:membrane-bound lytic murein transglycosylase MltF
MMPMPPSQRNRAMRLSLAVMLWLACAALAADAREPGRQPDTPPSSMAATLPEDYSVALRPWKGDYDGMVQRRLIRIAVPYSMTHYFLDGAVERGVSAAMGRQLEREVNRREGLRTRRVHVVFVPVPRNQLLEYVAAGRADIAMGHLRISERNRRLVDFSMPFIRDSREVVVSGPGAEPVVSIEDLAGRAIPVPSWASYGESLERLSRSFVAAGLAPITIDEVQEPLEPDEILELVQAGLLPATVMDLYLAEFWARSFPNLVVHADLVVASGHDIGWAMRKNSPQLQTVLNEFLRTHRPRTEFGNIILRRYLQNDAWVLRTTSARDREALARTLPLFERFGDRYRIDPLLLAALGYQESRLDQSVRSPAGTIGVMQLLPETGAAMNVGDITRIEPNIHAGARYLRTLIDRTEGQGLDALNTVFFALASYNAGQTRIRRLRQEAARQGLDADVWLDNVELVVAREVGREPVQYVRNIYLYYLAFQRVEAKRAQRASRAGLR